MPHSRHALKAAVAALFMLASAQAFAWGSAAHSPDSGYVYVKTHAHEPEAAEEAAIALCEEDSGGTCFTAIRAVRANAIVIAKDHWQREFVHAHPQPLMAMRTALAKCKMKGGICTVGSVDWDTGATWMSVAGNGAAFHVVANHASRAEAVEAAVLGCEQVNKGETPCEVAAAYTTSRRVYLSVARLEGYDWHGIGSENTHDSAQASAARKCVEHAEWLKRKEGSLKPEARCKVAAPILNDGPVAPPDEVQQVIAAIHKQD